MLGKELAPDTLVVLESTTYPGTTEELFQPLIEAGGLKVGTDLNLAFSPERVDPGNKKYGIKNTPKVVGGVTEQCTQRAVDFYASFIDTVVPAKGTREAEMAKLLENTYRHINIALVNEMARFSHELGIDLGNVIECAKTKPFGFQAFYPGARRRGALHPDRPELPVAHGSGAAALPVPVRGVGPGGQCGHAGLRRPPHPGPAQR
jgi:UDP-N-acetyl-D-glucosamine dehydrogenase